MPINPENLLELAERLVGEEPGALEDDLRRGVSTAYYALFHLLIKETTTSFLSDPILRARVGRAFQHGAMKAACEYYCNLAKQGRKTQPRIVEGEGSIARQLAPEVAQIAATFIELHDAREQADYDDAAILEHSDALMRVQRVRGAFQTWLIVQSDPSTVGFLQELLCRSILSKRRTDAKP